MRFSPLSIVRSIIICNIFIFACVQGRKSSSSTATSEGDADGEEKHNIRFTNNISNTNLNLSANINNNIINNNIINNQLQLKSDNFHGRLKDNEVPSPHLDRRSRSRKVCSGIHIRNDLKSFEQLRGCTVIDGPLTIALVSNITHPYEPKDYENITFPHLVEVTEYLLFFRVQGLTTLSRLFPNLSVIRGNRLVSNYAFIIYEMMHLQKIYLPRLADILRGSVRIENNPNLCYVTTVNWEVICKHTFGPHFIKDNNARCNNRCPEYCNPWTPKSASDTSKQLQGDVKELGAENNRSLFCWTASICNDFCQDPTGIGLARASDGLCCSRQCAGGCYSPNNSGSCYTCRTVSQEDDCVDRCKPTYFEYKGNCITEDACIAKIETVQQDNCDKSAHAQTISNLKPIKLTGDKHGQCQSSCPAGFEEDPSNKHKCQPCDRGKCRKVCTPPGNDRQYTLTNVNSLREISGCNSINGSLEISMKGGRNVLHELEAAFSDLEEITGYLKITRSHPILTLGFLTKLKAINGSILDRGLYSLIIIDNPNLQELFLFNKTNPNSNQLNISNGKIFVHLNPKLCPHRINDLKLYATIAPWDETDVSTHTNGDKEACDTQPLAVEFVFGGPNTAIIRFQNFAAKMDDPRSLLYYLINYREVPNGTVTVFDGRDGCNSQNDVWNTIEEYPAKAIANNTADFQDIAIKVKPATRYALYVKTFTILAGSTGALSDIIYFETAPDTPGIPRQLESIASSPNSVIVSWSAPSKPNGIIARYSLTITKAPELDDFVNVDVCDQIDTRDKITKTLTKEEPIHSVLVPIQSVSNSSDPSSTSSVPTCKSSLESDPDLVADVVTFQDTIIDIVYLKQPCTYTGSKNRKRRSIEHKLDNLALGQMRPSLSESILTSSLESSNISIVKPISDSGKGRIHFDRRKNKMEMNITAPRFKPESRMSYTIDGLDHYSLYTIEIRACHGDFLENNNKPLTTYTKCGLQAITQIRTQPIDELDRVSGDSIVFHKANDSFTDNLITWKKPELPNGLLLGFRVRYRQKYDQDLRGVGIACVNMSMYSAYNGIILPNLSPGSYVLNVQTISMYTGQRLWSEPDFILYVEDSLSTTQKIMMVLALFGILVLMILGGLGFVYHQKKQHELAYASVNPDYIQYEPDEWEVEQSKLKIGALIGEGSFGMVYKGELITEKGTISCAIKTVPKTSTAKQRMDFLREASIMKQFDTYHVIKLLGVVSVTTPVYVIMDYMENGDLKKFLRSQRDPHQTHNKKLVEGAYLMAAQIADGMAYLASKKFVHRDLAARNCMVGEKKVVKIGDFGLTRDVYANDYYRRDTHGRLPVRWMAPESLKDNIYTSASDVWSYGIVIWEIVTLCEYPYQGLSNDEVIKKVKSGYTMPKPEHCPSKLSEILSRCWRRNDRDRPTFNELVEYLLPEVEDQLFPNCFYRKRNKETEGDILSQSIPEENNSSGTEFYPLLMWPSRGRANGLTNGVSNHQHVQEDGQDDDDRHH